MTSQIEKLAEAVIAIGRSSGPAQTSLAELKRRSERTAAQVPNDEANRAGSIRADMYAASAALSEALSALWEFGQTAEAFAGRLVGGSKSVDAGSAIGVAGPQGATEVAGGLAFFASGDPTLQSAKRLAAFPGMRKYDLHGDTHSVAINGIGLSPKEFADVVRSDVMWKNQPIMLFACNTGKLRADGSCFAQDLADELGVPVTAPTQLAWANGKPFSASSWLDHDGNTRPKDPPDGEFKEFTPET